MSGWESSHALDDARDLLDSGRPEEAARLIIESWIELLVDGHATQTDLLLASLPEPHSDDAEALAVRACCARLRGDVQGARLLLSRARARRGSTDESPLYALFIEDDEDRLASAVDRGVAVLEQGSLRGRSHPYAVYLVGWTLLRLRRDAERAFELLEAARADASARGLGVLASRATKNRAFALAFAGEFDLATKCSMPATAAEDGPWRVYDGGIEGVTRGYIAYWRGDLLSAQKSFDAVIIEEGDAPYAHLARVMNAYIAARNGSAEARVRAHLDLQRVPDVTKLGVPWRVWRASAECLLAQAHGRSARAIQIARFVLSNGHVPVARAMATDVLRQNGELRDVRQTSEAAATRGTPPYVVAYSGLTDALLARERGEDRSSHIHLERALDVAAPQRALGAFLRDEAAAEDLLSSHAAWGTAHGAFVGQILAARGSITRTLDGELSPREREVLDYLRTDLTTAEIAEALKVSINTVKTHQRAVYRKLGVGTRREAVKLRR